MMICLSPLQYFLLKVIVYNTISGECCDRLKVSIPGHPQLRGKPFYKMHVRKLEGNYRRMKLLDKTSHQNVYQMEEAPIYHLFISDRGAWQIGQEYEVSCTREFFCSMSVYIHI